MALKRKRVSTPRRKASSSFKKPRITYTKVVVQKKEKKGVDMILEVEATPPDMDTDDIHTVMSTNDYVYPINLIQSGSGSWQRIGRKVHNHSVRIKAIATCYYGPDGDTVPAVFSRVLRVLLVHDKQPNGALPIKSAILAQKNQAGTETSDYQSQLSYDNMDRFKILRDSTYVMDPPRPNEQVDDGTAGMSTQCKIDEYVKINIPTNYSSESTPASIADISTGAIYLVLLTNTIAADTPDSGHLSLHGTVRLRYTD